MANSTSNTEFHSVKQAFQGLIPDSTAIILGVVTSIEPLQIKIVNDEKLILNGNTTINARIFKNRTLGDKPLYADILSVNSGKKYYVLSTWTED